ncbi:MAG: CinA family nicotinamide mononucleotide deamidase-related protein [Deltaproteobacteria bacterium]|nr:CinA family nicotinamide mononucleotide deamidase-related protein [Deltaproteobacteria bacterium]
MIQPLRIEVICTGDEVLTGKIVNSNYSYIAQKLEDHGFTVQRGVTVGDDRAALLAAFREAGVRSDAVIVNGGLGPTVDDLSQEVAAQAAGVGLELHEPWVARMEAFFTARGRVMPENNRKQALLPQGSEVLDNPVGTACGFALTIGHARFFFTPGVPRELFRMLEGEILPRLLQRAGAPGVIVLKRFHSYGLGESHVDQMLLGLEALVPEGRLKLGFRAHYPQLETKLTMRARDAAEARRLLEPAEAEVRARLGNFILAEDNQTLEGVVLELLKAQGAALAVVEDFTGGQIAARLAPQPGAEAVFRRGIVGRSLADVMAALNLNGAQPGLTHSPELAADMARAAREQTGVSHALAVLVALEGTQEDVSLTGSIHLALAGPEGVLTRRSRLAGGREWVRLGAVEMGLDCLRRHLQGLPLKEKTDFEKEPPR